MSKNTDRHIKSALVVFEIVEQLQELEGAGVTELAESMGMAKSTVHQYLSTLHHQEYLTKEDGEYDLSLRFLDHGGYAKNRYSRYVIIEEMVESLAEETDERVQFVVEEFGHAVYVHRAVGDNAMRLDTRVGKRYPLHVISAGKAILAHLPDERVSEIIERRNLSVHTSNTITDPDELREELRECRELGYSKNDQENVKGSRAIGVPISDENDDILGAISVSGPVSRFKGEFFESELAELLIGKANELELQLEHAILR